MACSTVSFLLIIHIYICCVMLLAFFFYEYGFVIRLFINQLLVLLKVRCSLLFGYSWCLFDNNYVKFYYKYCLFITATIYNPPTNWVCYSQRNRFKYHALSQVVQLCFSVKGLLAIIRIQLSNWPFCNKTLLKIGVCRVQININIR